MATSDALRASPTPEPCFGVKTIQGRRRNQLFKVGIASVASVALLLVSAYFLTHQCHSPFINNNYVKLTGFSLGAAGTVFFTYQKTKRIVANHVNLKTSEKELLRGRAELEAPKEIDEL